MSKKTINTPEIETSRLFLRRFTEQDIEAILAIHQDEAVNTYLPWFPLRTYEEAEDFFEKRYASVYRQPCGYQYAVCLKSSGLPVGYVSVSMDDSHDLGYGLRREFWYQGIASEAARAVVLQLKKDGLLYVTATHDVQNPRSGAVMKRLGMRYQYSYQEQWQPKDISVIFRMYQLNFDGSKERVYIKYWDNAAVRFIEENV